MLNWPLVPQDQVHFLIKACEADLERMASPEEATKIGRLFIGMFPRAQPVNPEAYVLGLTGLLCAFPWSIVQEHLIKPPHGMVFSLTGKFTDAAPSLAMVKEWLDRALGGRTGLLRKAKWIERERERRRKVAEEDRIFTEKKSKDVAVMMRELADRIQATGNRDAL